jgi:hypothetical protein
MKKLLKTSIAIFILLVNHIAFAQTEEKPEPSVNIQYYNLNGALQYLKLNVMVKQDKKLQPVSNAGLQVYLDEAVTENLIGNVKTNEKGNASTTIPPSLKDKWALSPNHKFIAVLAASKHYAEVTGEIDIVKAKIVLDTLNEEDTRKVRAQVFAFDSGQWVPAKEVEVKLGVRRLGGDLKIGEEETYTTDSLGQVVGEFKLDKLPALTAKNEVVLVAKTEENELYGNLAVEKSVPWGLFTRHESNFNKRSLWGTRDKAPLWLMFIAFSIIVGVWGALIYLGYQIAKIKRLGKEEEVAGPVLHEPALDVVEVEFAGD